MGSHSENWTSQVETFGDWGPPCFAAWTGGSELWARHLAHCARCQRDERTRGRGDQQSPEATGGAAAERQPREPLGITNYAEPNRVRRGR